MEQISCKSYSHRKRTPEEKQCQALEKCQDVSQPPDMWDEQSFLEPESHKEQSQDWLRA